MNEFDLKLGATVYCRDGKCGQLAKFVADPKTHEVRDLIVEKGFLLKEARIFPVALVERVTADGIELGIDSGAVKKYRKYQQKTVEQPVAAGSGVEGALHTDAYGTVMGGPRVGTVSERVHEGVSPALVVLDGNTNVVALESGIGSLTHIVIAPESGSIRRLVARRGALLAKSLIVPGPLLRGLSEERLQVEATDGDMAALPEYTPLANEAGTRPPHETAPTIGEQTEVAGDSLTTAIERALLADPRTEFAAIDVIEDRGVITLEGTVDSRPAREAAEEIAAGYAGVLSVTNNLRVD